MKEICLLVLFALSFVLAVFSYRKGLTDGMKIKEGKTIEKPKKPKKEDATHIREGIERDIANILNYQNRRMKHDEN